MVHLDVSFWKKIFLTFEGPRNVPVGVRVWIEKANHSLVSELHSDGHQQRLKTANHGLGTSLVLCATKLYSKSYILGAGCMFGLTILSGL